MSWTAPITFVDGDPLTSAQLNVYVRDNMLETGPGKATRASRVLATAGLNNVVERQWSRAYVSGSITVDDQFPITEDTSGTLYGPTVTVEHGGFMLIMYDTLAKTTVGSGGVMYAPEVDGERLTTSDHAIRTARDSLARWGCWTWYHTDPGVSTVTMAYGTYGQGTAGQYVNRRLSVLPF